jgi:hypothetical protein
MCLLELRGVESSLGLGTIARWLKEQEGVVIFGIDANCPEADRPDIRENEWWLEDEPLLLGPDPLHDLKESYRIFLESNPDEMQRILAERSNGPLAVSQIRGNSRRYTECRYDFIYVSSEVRV